MARRPNSMRYRGFDYFNAGAYFITTCVQDRIPLFGKVVDGVMQLNDAGRIVEQWWNAITERFPMVVLDDHIVMPDHFHGILIIEPPTGALEKSISSRTAVTLGNVLGWFKFGCALQLSDLYQYSPQVVIQPIPKPYVSSQEILHLSGCSFNPCHITHPQGQAHQYSHQGDARLRGR